MHCLRQIGSSSGTNDPSDPAHEIALRVIIVMLEDNSFGDDYPLIPRRRHHALLTAARTTLDSARLASARSQLPPQPRQPPLPWIGPDTA